MRNALNGYGFWAVYSVRFAYCVGVTDKRNYSIEDGSKNLYERLSADLCITTKEVMLQNPFLLPNFEAVSQVCTSVFERLVVGRA